MSGNRMRRTAVCAAIGISLSAALYVSCLLPVQAGSSLIDPSRMRASKTNYRTEEVAPGELTQSFSMAAIEVFPLNRRAILTNEMVDGHTAVHKETLVRVGDIVEAGDPVEEIEVLVDTVDLAEKELRLTRLTERYEAELEARRTSYEETAASLGISTDALEEKLAKGAEAGEENGGSGVFASLTPSELKAVLAKLELDRYVLENERQISQLSAEVNRLHELQEVRYITAPISGKISDITIFHTGDRIQAGQSICSVLDEDVMLVMGENTGLRTGMRATVETGQGNRRVKMEGTVVAAPDTSPVMAPDRGFVALDPGERDPNMRWLNMRIEAVNFRLDNIIVVSRDALEATNGKFSATTLDAEGNTHTRGAVTGLRTPQRIWVLQGLEEGDQVVLH